MKKKNRLLWIGLALAIVSIVFITWTCLPPDPNLIGHLQGVGYWDDPPNSTFDNCNFGN